MKMMDEELAIAPAARKAQTRSTARSKPNVARRPVNFDARQALIDATAHLLRESIGIEPSVVEIAKEAGVNPGLIGYYFGSKDGLLLELLTRDMGMRHDQMVELMELNAPATDKIKMHISGLVNHFFTCPYANHLINVLVKRGTKETADAVTERLIRPIIDVHTQMLADGVKTGELRPVDPMLFYFTVLGACDRIFSAQLSLRSIFHHDGIDADLKRRFIDHTIDVLLPGLLADPAEAKNLPPGARLSTRL